MISDKKTEDNMGGIGSGRSFFSSTKLTTNECKAIDVRRWHKIGYLKSGLRFNWQWSINGEKVGYINVETQLNKVLLHFRARSYGEEWEPITQTIQINHTPCNYGGNRPWFHCPHCGKRVVLLYAASKLFLCRHCYHLPYASQEETKLDRMLRQIRKIRNRLDASTGIDWPIYDKPKGMHWKTFEYLKTKEQRLNQRYEMLYTSRLSSLMKLLNE